MSKKRPTVRELEKRVLRVAMGWYIWWRDNVHGLPCGATQRKMYRACDVLARRKHD